MYNFVAGRVTVYKAALPCITFYRPVFKSVPGIYGTRVMFMRVFCGDRRVGTDSKTLATVENREILI